jgi:ribonuclease J
MILTEPFNASMELDQKRVQNWLEHFNLDMRKAHASGHISQPEIREMVEEIDPEKLFAIHTEEPEWFRRFALDVPKLEHGEPYFI